MNDITPLSPYSQRVFPKNLFLVAIEIWDPSFRIQMHSLTTIVLSNVLEKVVANRLHEHMYIHHLSNDLQSAYELFHSSETALLKIHNDIVVNMDNGKVTALTLLDLSAAFDMLNHVILLQSFHWHFGISGTALRWFKSYFSDKHQSNNISGTLSSVLSAARICPWPCSV